jgi:hypothetical protein
VFCVDGLNCKVSESEEKLHKAHHYISKSATISGLKTPFEAIKERYGPSDINACLSESDRRGRIRRRRARDGHFTRRGHAPGG